MPEPLFDEQKKHLASPQNTTMPPFSSELDNESVPWLDGTTIPNCPSSPRKVARHVAFDLCTNETFAIPHRRDQTPDDLSKTWYTKKELNANKYSARLLVKRIDLGLPVQETDQITARGLDIFTRAGLWRKHFIRGTIRTVVDAQNMKLDTDKEMYLRKISETMSREMVKDALKTGQRDAAFSREYLLSVACDSDFGNDETDEVLTTQCISFCNLVRHLDRLKRCLIQVAFLRETVVDV